MSAFLVDPDHIRQLIAFCAKDGMNSNTAEATAGVLARANLESIQVRYPTSWEGFLEGRGETAEGYVELCKKPARRDMGVTLADIAGMIHCFEYQCDESKGWEKSLAKAECENIRYRLTSRLRQVGQADAYWEYSPGTVKDRADKIAAEMKKRAASFQDGLRKAEA